MQADLTHSFIVYTVSMVILKIYKGENSCRAMQSVYIVDRLDVNQYGGLRVLYTTHALVDMVHTWLLTAEERKASHVVFWTTVKLSITWITH